MKHTLKIEILYFICILMYKKVWTKIKKKTNKKLCFLPHNLQKHYMYNTVWIQDKILLHSRCWEESVGENNTAKYDRVWEDGEWVKMSTV